MKITAEKFSMKEKSFLEILTEKVEQRVREEVFSSESPDKNFVSQRDFSQNNVNSARQTEKSEEIPLWVQQIPLGKIEFQRPKATVFGRAYPKNTSPQRGNPRPPKAQVQVELRQKHNLNEKQNQAFAYFLQWKMGLRQDFTESELKRSFRLLAHKLHPDRNEGVTAHYIEMKRHYEALKELFKTPQAA